MQASKHEALEACLSRSQGRGRQFPITGLEPEEAKRLKFWKDIGLGVGWWPAGETDTAQPPDLCLELGVQGVRPDSCPAMGV